jgi:transcriptional regulator with XRE-family HTH domain
MDDAEVAGKLLHDARLMAGLTQADVAQRAGIAQQTVALYERGARQPSVATLTRLIAGCGLRLSWRLVPEPGLDDEPTRELLARAPLERLDPALRTALVRIAEANRGLTLVFGGKVAARMHGANVRVDEVDIWVDPLVDLDELTAFLVRADIVYVSPIGATAPAVATRERLLEGWPLAGRDADVFIRSARLFEDLLGRSSAAPFNSAFASPDDCIRWWHDRDLDHLALQRAIRLANQDS